MGVSWISGAFAAATVATAMHTPTTTRTPRSITMRRMSYQTFLLAEGRNKAEIVPERGAIVTRLTVDGRDVLFMDYDTLADPTKSIRGGVPVLFPFAGALPE